jgi:hypothetical protein
VDWYSVLVAARRVASRKPVFNSTDLALEAKIEATERSEAHQIASAWLGKFVRWGYAVRAGHDPGERSWRGYSLTNWGATIKKGFKKKGGRP